MKVTNTLIALVLACAASAAQEPQGPATKTTSGGIPQQIKNLDNDSFDVRTKAMEELRAAGEGARADLEAAKKSESLEVRTRAETLLKELDDKKAGGTKFEGLRPVNPDEEVRARRPVLRGGGMPPRPEDFPDVNGYSEAMRKWMEEQSKTSRFTWVLPDGKELERDMAIIGRGGMGGAPGGGSFSFVQIKDGEKMTYKTGPDGITMDIEKKDETGKTVNEKYTAKDSEEFKAKHPEVWEKYKPMEVGGLTWTTAQGFPGRVDVARPVQPGFLPLTPKIDLNQPRLGVTTSPVPPVLEKQLKLKGEGLVIDSVFPDSLASRLGIQDLDVLVALDGQVVRDRDDILRVLTQKDAPATATAKVVREGATVELSAPRAEKAK